MKKRVVHGRIYQWLRDRNFINSSRQTKLLLYNKINYYGEDSFVASCTKVLEEYKNDGTVPNDMESKYHILYICSRCAPRQKEGEGEVVKNLVKDIFNE